MQLSATGTLQERNKQPSPMLPERTRKRRRKYNECANCYYRFEGIDNYCPNCGQENHSMNAPMRHVFRETLESIFHFDTKFWNTARLLIFKPGQLTAEFNAGHRVRYVPPIRLYFFISFVFFLLITAGLGLHSQKREKMMKGFSEGKSITIGSSTYSGAELEKLNRDNTNEQAEALLHSKGKKPDFISRFAVRQMAKFRGNGLHSFQHLFLKNVSLLMFVLMPLFALLLKGAHWRRHRHYVEFLVFSLHFHSFLFVLFSLLWLCTAFVTHPVFSWAAVVLPLLYLGVAVWRAVPQSTFKAAWKTVAVAGMYGLSLLVFFLATALVSMVLF
jgi:hypothetical protein